MAAREPGGGGGWGLESDNLLLACDIDKQLAQPAHDDAPIILGMRFPTTSMSA